MNETFERVSKFFEFDGRGQTAFLLTGLFFGLILAFVYTFWGGPEVVSNEGYQLYDSMLFSVAFLLSFPFSALLYYFTNDVSLSLAPVAGAAFSLFSGFEDLMVYVFCTVRQTGACADVSGLPGKWPWLEGSFSFLGLEFPSYFSFTAGLIGSDSVTDFSLVVGVVFGLLASLTVLKILDSFDPEGYPRL